MPPAESILVQRICEVRPGADPVKCGKAKVAGDVLHTLHAVSRLLFETELFYSIGQYRGFPYRKRYSVSILTRRKIWV